jgi:hypothetical protein
MKLESEGTKPTNLTRCSDWSSDAPIVGQTGMIGAPYTIPPAMVLSNQQTVFEWCTNNHTAIDWSFENNNLFGQ